LATNAAEQVDDEHGPERNEARPRHTHSHGESKQRQGNKPLEEKVAARMGWRGTRVRSRLQ
jgi:hypothetical protein